MISPGYDDIDDFLEPTDRSSDCQHKTPIKEQQHSNTVLSLGEYQGKLEPKTNLSWTEKGLLIKIRKLSNSRGCTASNRQLSEYIGVSERSVSRTVSSLVKTGYLNVEFPTSKNRSVFCSDKIN